MRWREIIIEGYSREKTLATYGKKLRYGRLSKSPEETISYLESIDPTSKKAFTRYLVHWYANKSMRYLEDASKAIPAMELVSKFKNKMKNVDLSKISFSQFLDLGDKLEGEKSKTETNKEEEQAFYDSGEAVLFYNDSDIKVVIPKTKEAAQYFGKNTRWCTSATSSNMFNVYNRDGPLYIILFKKENKRWQFHFESSQFMDEMDEEIGCSVIRNNPIIQRIFKNEFEMSLAVQEGARAILYIKNPSEEVQKLAVQQNGYAIEYIKNPSEDLQKSAVQENGNAILYIKNPSEEIQKLAIQQNGYAIRYINNPSEEIQKLAVQKNSLAIEDIKNPSEEVQKLAVQQNGTVIAFIKNPSEAIQRLAVQQDGNAIAYIKNPSEELKKLAKLKQTK